MTKVFTIVANEAIDLSTTECTLMQFSYNPEQIYDPDDFDFVVRCWDGDDYQIESRYKVIKEEEE